MDGLSITENENNVQWVSQDGFCSTDVKYSQYSPERVYIEGKLFFLKINFSVAML